MNEPLDAQARLDLVAAYALGVLPASEAGLVATLILSDPEARREYDELRATANLIGLAAEEPVDSARSARM
jgi:anti-sigma factor RsiW